MNLKKSFTPDKFRSVSGFSQTPKMTLMAGLLLAQLIISQPSIAEDKVELRPVPEDAPIVVAPAPGKAQTAPIQLPVINPQPESEHPIMDKLIFPVKHPVQFMQNTGEMVIHPLATTVLAFDTFCTVGKWAEKKGLTAGLSLCGAAGSTVTPLIVGFFR